MASPTKRTWTIRNRKAAKQQRIRSRRSRRDIRRLAKAGKSVR